MKNKLLNTIQIILAPILLASLFIPMFARSEPQDGKVFHITNHYNFYEIASYDFVDYAIIWLTLIIISCFIILYMCKAAMHKFNEKQLPKFFALSNKLVLKDKFPITYFMPVICLLSLIIYCILYDGDTIYYSYLEYGYESVDITCLIPIGIALIMIIVSVIDFIKVKNSTNTKVGSAENMVLNLTPALEKQKNENIEDLIKLKDLLDKGIITQEDFDAKKKQILGL